MAKPERIAWLQEFGQGAFPKELPVIPLRNAVLLPGGVLSITAGRPKTLALLKDLEPNVTPVGIVTQKSAEVEDPTIYDMHDIGTVGRVIKIQRVNDEAFLIIVHGMARFKMDELIHAEPYWKARVSPVEETNKGSVETEALTSNLKDMARQLLEMLPEVPGGIGEMLNEVDEPGLLADLVGANLDLTSAQRLEILTNLDISDRLRRTLALLSQVREMIDVRQKINNQVRNEFSKHQREAILRQQMKVIQEELGEKDPSDELDELRKRIDEARLPEEAAKMARREFDRLKRMAPQQADYHVVRTYLEWMADLPWNTSTEDLIELDNVSKVLDEGHYGMQKVKRRILEYLAIRKLNPQKKGPILCLVGPPGVGKTSLGTAIATAIGRKFVRASLGGVRDEAEVRGHRRTYVGALPGRIVAGLRKAKSNNPVFLLDEIDKLGHSVHGDPSAALLEVLDPEQNASFSDHYLEVPFDLSKVMFIATANQLDTIPGPLRDRMEIIEVASYSPYEKLAIAWSHLLPKVLKDNGIKDGQIIFTNDILQHIIESYTREAGVRRLEQQLNSVLRGVALRLGRGEAGPIEITREVVVDALGTARFFPEIVDRIQSPGVATGLAWTAVGGDLLFIETTKMPGKGHMALTGQLGDVMKESAQAALSYVRSHALELGVPINFLEKEDIHIHFPAGGIPKDGPSAGVTIFTALTSLLTGRRVRSDVAMTGEVTLRGQVLPVGGIKEKVLAAHRGGAKRVILPARNESDLRDLPEETRNALEFVLVKEMSEVLRAALEPEIDASVELPASELTHPFPPSAPTSIAQA